MDATIFTQFFQEGYFIVCALVLGVCQVIKTKLPDKSFVPVIAMVLAVIFAVSHGALVLKTGFTASAIMNSLEQGIIAGAISVMGFDVVKGVVSKLKAPKE